MSHPQPPQRQPTTADTGDYTKVLHNVAIGCLVVCPIVALLPPRKLDIFTIGLGGMGIYSANYLVQEQTGRSVWRHVSERKTSSVAAPTRTDSQLDRLQEQLRQQRQEMASGAELMQGSRRPEDWKVRRDEEVKEALDEGKGFGDMIIDQVWEVWNWGKKQEDDEED